MVGGRWLVADDRWRVLLLLLLVLEGIGNRPELKCTWSEAIKLYKDSGLNAQMTHSASSAS